MESTKKRSNKNPPDYLNVEQARNYLGVSRSTVYSLVKKEKIPSRRFGKNIKIHKKRLLEYIRRME